MEKQAFNLTPVTICAIGHVIESSARGETESASVLNLTQRSGSSETQAMDHTQSSKW